MDNGSRAALIVLDGWAERDSGTDENRNAVADADTPNFDRLRSGGASGLLRTHGRSVGLSEGQMGNSEVGHLNIGAGRVVKQPLARIDDAIEDGRFFENDVLVEAVESGNHLHLMGLVSDGGVHSAQRHLHALLELADEHGREPVVHAFLDGRDTPPKSAVGYLQDLEKKTKKTGGTVGTVAGRYYAMDRDVNWDRTRLAYDAVTRGDGEEVKTASNPVEAVERAYERGETDEFVKPTIVGDAPGVSDGDSVVFFNFRADRARQLTRMINGMRPEDLEGTSEEAWEGAGLGVDFATMTEYDEVFDFPVAYPPEIPDNVLGEVVSDAGLSQFRIAETEKYA
ncbi:MAG: 2,3-bisphosphoglycerate-independent phosphoglycerate mutase, partial [Halobacteria archaeon]|nr:2,3-bisphosphoglycerate-independent phosphoglycerate mutase [Halobacteria archaeon]